MSTTFAKPNIMTISRSVQLKDWIDTNQYRFEPKNKTSGNTMAYKASVASIALGFKVTPANIRHLLESFYPQFINKHKPKQPTHKPLEVVVPQTIESLQQELREYVHATAADLLELLNSDVDFESRLKAVEEGKGNVSDRQRNWLCASAREHRAAIISITSLITTMARHLGFTAEIPVLSAKEPSVLESVAATKA